MATSKRRNFVIEDFFKPSGPPKTMVVNVRRNLLQPRYNNLKEWCEDSTKNVYIGRRHIVLIYVNGNSISYPISNSLWCNPFKVDENYVGHNRQEVIESYETYIRKKIDHEPEIYNLESLKFKRLGCWCKPLDCHGDILVKLIEETDEQ